MRRFSHPPIRASLLTSLLVSALILNPLASSVVNARAEEGPAERAPLTFAETVKNTKETESILLKSEDLTGNPDDEESLPPFPDDEIGESRLREAFASVAETMDPREGEPPIDACEPLLLSRLQTEIGRQGLPADPEATRYSLLLLRKMNVIDDVTLLPLLAVFPAWSKNGYRESEWIRKDAEGRTAVVDCPTDQYLRLVASVKTAKGRKMKRRHIRDRIKDGAKEKNDEGELRYLPVQITWLLSLEKTRYDKETAFSLGTVLKQVADAKDSSPRADPEDKPTKVMSKKKKKTGGLSNRLALYAKYNSFQINKLSEQYKKFTERMDLFSSEAELVIKYKDGRDDEVYPLSQQEQYRMAAKMLHKDVEELKLSGLFAGKSPTFDDVIVAAVETGFLHASELDAAMGVDDVWNPKVSGWTKVLNIVKKYGSTALVLIPNPVSFWASLGITLAETLITKKVQGPGNADDHGISIF
jgi:hypothetical protein